MGKFSETNYTCKFQWQNTRAMWQNEIDFEDRNKISINVHVVLCIKPALYRRE